MATAEPRRQSGFTLIEMMVALGILLLGVTALLAALSGGADLYRESDARLRAAQFAETAFLQVQQGMQRRGDDPLAIEPEPVDRQPVPGGNGMTWTLRIRADEQQPLLLLATIAVQWLQEGEVVEHEFHRLLPRQEPMRVRVQRHRDERNSTR